MEKKILHVRISRKKYEVPVLFVEPEELIPAFKFGKALFVYRFANEYWEQNFNPQNASLIYALEHNPSVFYNTVTNAQDPTKELEVLVANELVCNGVYYKKAVEPRYYICPNVTWRRVDMTFNAKEAQEVEEQGLRVFNAFEYEKALAVGNMIRLLAHEDSVSPKDVCPPPIIEVLDPNYKPTIGGNSVPYELVTVAGQAQPSAAATNL